jgi:hypothetical protein
VASRRPWRASARWPTSWWCGVDSDFFDLGGRSVEAMLAGRINAALDVRITMADLFKAPTVADLDRRLDQMAGTRK